jgi:PAS domain S-box-containing protein
MPPSRPPAAIRDPLSTKFGGSRTQRGLLVGAVALSLGIFLLDVSHPNASQAFGGAYVLVILLGLWIASPVYPLLAAAGVTGLLIVDLVTGWTDGSLEVAFVNYPLMTALCWVSAALVVRFKRLEQHSAAEVGRLAGLKAALDEAAIVASTDVSGRITDVNGKFCEISKFSREELLGKDHRVINSGTHLPEFFRDLWQTIARGHVWKGEIQNRAKDGSLYWVDTTIVPFVNAQGKPYQYTAIRHDITERKRGEERLRHQEALARVGQLAAMVAHEVKNPLAGIKGALQVIVSRRPAGDPEVPVMHDIIQRADELNELISDLLLFSRPKPPQLAPLDLHPVLMESMNLLKRDPLGRDLTTQVEGQSAVISGDRSMLRAIFSNLFINAAQAMQGSGSLHVVITAGAEHVEVRVRDTGPGIPPHVRDQIFEPFFTTKSRGGGLGLAIARRSVELHGGRIDIESPPEGGALVTVTLPIGS